MEKTKKMTLGYADGIAVMAATYAMSPPQDKIRNTVVIGIVHGALHGFACKKLNERPRRGLNV